jgi:hypothetical protein
MARRRPSLLHAASLQDGQQLPGQKGISLPEDQWAKLLSGLPGLAEALDRA